MPCSRACARCSCCEGRPLKAGPALGRDGAAICGGRGGDAAGPRLNSGRGPATRGATGRDGAAMCGVGRGAMAGRCGAGAARNAGAAGRAIAGGAAGRAIAGGAAGRAAGAAGAAAPCPLSPWADALTLAVIADTPTKNVAKQTLRASMSLLAVTTALKPQRASAKLVRPWLPRPRLLALRFCDAGRRMSTSRSREAVAATAAEMRQQPKNCRQEKSCARMAPNRSSAQST